MIKILQRTILICIFSLSLSTCIEPFDTESDTFTDYLVVEGFLSDKASRHQIKLSRTSPFDSSINRFEEGAQVWLSTNNQEVIPFTETQAGIYLSDPSISGIVGLTYQLNILTRDEKTYQSSPVILKPSPSIDSVYAHYLPASLEQGAGIFIYLDSHNPSQGTRFYRWEFEETYEIRPPFPSTYVWLGGNDFEFRHPDVVGRCWRTDPSSNILVSTTQNQSEDRISQFELRFIPEESFIMRFRYSILVKQYALNQESYLFWDALREFTENPGSLFDIQPGTSIGNIVNVNNPNELVLGYFDASQSSELRVFFTPQNFTPDGFIRPPYLNTCEEFTESVPSTEIGNYMTQNNNAETREIWAAFGSNPATFVTVPKDCGNCTNIGTTQIPDFWE